MSLKGTVRGGDYLWTQFRKKVGLKIHHTCAIAFYGYPLSTFPSPSPHKVRVDMEETKRPLAHINA